MTSTYTFDYLLRFILVIGLSSSLARSAFLIRPPSSNLTQTLPSYLTKPLGILWQTHCIHDVIPPIVPVDSHICARTFSRLLSLPDVDTPYQYNRGFDRAKKLTYAPCAISLDRLHNYGRTIVLSFREIVESAARTLHLCQPYGQGGWEHVEGYEQWIIIVEGL